VLEDADAGVDAEAPTLRIPGRVAHINPEYGEQRASWVPCDFASLTVVQLAPHMVNDHRGKEYLKALKGVTAARTAAEPPPRWVGFNAAPPHCACCSAPFAWESTFRSAAHEVCARHHCRGCGRVVCDACSHNRSCLPQFGIVEPERVCDACFFTL